MTQRVVVLLVGIAVVSACTPSREAAVADGAPIVLISIDTLRSDRLSMYGYTGGETPQIDALGADSVVFERAYSHCPLTLPSHTSLFTGLLPPRHGVRDNRGFALDGTPPTLAAQLAGAGYQTAGFVSSMVLRRDTGIGRGFEVYDDEIGASHGGGRAFAERPGRQTLRRALAWLEQRDASRPFFLFVHLFEPHAPYDAPEPYASAAREPYDAEVRHVDAIVGELLEALRGVGMYDESLIVLLSDHGEGLGDHGEAEHGILLYREALQVPLLVKLPHEKLAGKRIAEPVGLSDVAATVLDLVGVAGPAVGGRILLGPNTSVERSVIYGESMFGRYQYGWSETRSAIRDEFHYIEAPNPELFDLAADPDERRNLLAARDAPVALLQALEEIGPGASRRVEIGAEQRRRLASLGYVGGGAVPDDATGLPDPKLKIGDARALWSFVHGDDEPRSAYDDTRLRAHLESIGPVNEYLHRLVAGALLHEGRARMAHEVVAPYAASEDPASHVVLGQSLAALGRPAEARRSFERASELDPGSAEAQLGLALVRMSSGDYDAARPFLLRAVELDPQLAEAWNGLGVVRMQGGDVGGALEAWTRTVAVDPELGDAWFNLALVRRRTGDVAGAEQALRSLLPLVEGSDERRVRAMLDDLARGG
ncbi:MAG: sulfatase-like hydrolase/transferase [bacterium]|nr:sulfatase-like hydrolase/transferase [bacterium]